MGKSLTLVVCADDKVYLGDLVGGLKPSASAGALKKKIVRVSYGKVYLVLYVSCLG